MKAFVSFIVFVASITTAAPTPTQETGQDLASLGKVLAEDFAKTGHDFAEWGSKLGLDFSEMGQGIGKKYETLGKDVAADFSGSAQQ